MLLEDKDWTAVGLLVFIATSSKVVIEFLARGGLRFNCPEDLC